ncbi:MAG TPA: tetratricopeptide repeat protein [Anaeromyxobacteraceae bacterium]|nr:tetratricopeptide repeat protein [Anaeromyxobacteraceae bacterium]
MTQTWLLWYLLASLTGHPLGVLLAILVIGWLGDRLSFGWLPSPLRLMARLRRIGELRRTLATNPHDRRARLELADLLLKRRPQEAAALARQNVEAGDEDVPTVFLLGAALARSGSLERAEQVLSFAEKAEPGFRMGEIDLELGRLRLARGDFDGAQEVLTRFVAQRPGTVEGRYLLARALAGRGDLEGARRVRAEGWREYRTLPRFRRREERPFAARLRPLRSALVLGVAVAAALLVLYSFGAHLWGG